MCYARYGHVSSIYVCMLPWFSEVRIQMHTEIEVQVSSMYFLTFDRFLPPWQALSQSLMGTGIFSTAGAGFWKEHKLEPNQTLKKRRVRP